MKIVVFAGGVGTRLWPLSRKRSPKQFEKMIGEKSTLQLAVDRLISDFKAEDIYISTNSQYVGIIKKQLPQIPAKNVIGEPEMRDVGPAVALVTAILAKENKDEPMAILWSDHLVKEVPLFVKILKTAEDLVRQEKNKIVFIAQKPRFASQNLGWIEYGETVKKLNELEFKSFLSFKYRPDMPTAENFFKSGHHAWNLGYFVTTPGFLWSKFAEHTPAIHTQIEAIVKNWGKPDAEKTLAEIYPQVEKISFDDAILEKLKTSEAYLLSYDLGWSDVGAWEAVKEALESSPEENVTRGKVLVQDSRDSLVFNYQDKQLLVTIDADGLLVINTPDVILVCKKASVPKIKNLVNSLSGTEHEHLT